MSRTSVSWDDHTPPAIYTYLYILLFILTIVSSIFKLYYSLSQQSTAGVSYLYHFLGVVFNTSQWSVALFTNFFVLSGTFYDIDIDTLGVGALAGLFLILTSAVIWLYHVIIFVEYSYRISAAPSPDPSTTTDNSHLRQGHSLTYLITISRPTTLFPFGVFTFVYTLITLLPVFALSFINLCGLDAGIAFIYLAPVFCFQVIILPFLAVGQFVPQIMLMLLEAGNQDTRKSPLNVYASVLDAILYALLGFAYLPFLIRSDHASEIWSYLWWDWVVILLCGDYIVLGIGQAILLYIHKYSWQEQNLGDAEANTTDAQGGALSEGETEPLLAGGGRDGS